MQKNNCFNTPLPMQSYTHEHQLQADCVIRKKSDSCVRKFHILVDIWNRIPQMYVFSGLWGNLVNVMNKFAQCNEQKVWKTGHRNVQICGKIMSKFVAKYSGY